MSRSESSPIAGVSNAYGWSFCVLGAIFGVAVLFLLEIGRLAESHARPTRSFLKSTLFSFLVDAFLHVSAATIPFNFYCRTV